MSVITFTSDIGNHLWRITALKGKIYHYFPESHIIDFFHDKQGFRIDKAAYAHLFSQPQFDFPCIHLIYLQIEKNTEYDLLIIQNNQQFYIVPDNGFFFLANQETKDAKIYKTSIKSNDIWIDAVVEIIKNIQNNTLENIYEKAENPLVLLMPKPYFNSEILSGEILFTDNFGNAYTNFSQSAIEHYFPDNKFEIVLNNFDKISKISDTYQEVNESDILAKYGKAGFLKLAVKFGNAKDLFGLNEFKKINIQKR